jgi:tripartite-type tricarboxylate transporter receptor subunit TctC
MRAMHCLIMGLLFFLAGAGIAPAAAYPDHPIHLLVPYPAGGPNDVIARLIADKLSTAFDQQVIVENRAGGSGNVAVSSRQRARRPMATHWCCRLWHTR